MRIWLQKHVVEGRMPELDEWYREHVAAVVDPGTEVVTHTLPPEAYETDIPEQRVTFGALAHHFNHYFARSAAQADRDGFDAWVIAAGQDPGLDGARAMATIPTLGYGSVTFNYCLREGIRFGIIGFAEGLREPITANVERYGAGHLLADYAIIPGGPKAMAAAIAGDPQQFLDQVEEAATEAAVAGAQMIIPAEGLPAEALWHYGVRETGGLPVLDPLGLLLKSAETEVRLRELGSVARPTTGFWFGRPGDEALEEVERAFPGREVGGPGGEPLQ